MEKLSNQMTKPESEQRIAQMFDRIAPRYDLLNRLLSARQDQRWRKDLVNLVPAREGGVYLDVATGTGDVLIQVAKKHPEYSNFHGVDISEQMLGFAKLKTLRQFGKRSDIQYRPMSAEVLNFENATVDALSISFGLRNVVDRERAISEFSRVLKKNGMVFILEFFQPEGKVLRTMFDFYFHRILPVMGGLFSDRSAYTYLPKSVASFYSQAELETVMRRHGFNIEYAKKYLFGGCRLIVGRNVR